MVPQRPSLPQRCPSTPCQGWRYLVVAIDGDCASSRSSKRALIHTLPPRWYRLVCSSFSPLPLPPPPTPQLCLDCFICLLETIPSPVPSLHFIYGVAGRLAILLRTLQYSSHADKSCGGSRSCLHCAHFCCVLVLVKRKNKVVLKPYMKFILL